MVSTFVSALLVLLVSCACVSSTTTPPQGCMRDDKHYNVQDTFQPTPCEHCTCTLNGQVMCAIADCFFTPCVDSVHDPKQCCPVCPNGHNCQHPDGTIIKKGDVYHPDADTTCECPQNTWGMRGTVALCVMQPHTEKPLLVS